LNVFHNPLSRADQDFLPSPKQPAAHEPKQRRMMAVALALLVIALGFVLYQDRDFWFPDTQQSDDQLEPAPATAAPQPETKATAEQPAPVAAKTAGPEKKNHSAKSHLKNSSATSTATAASTEVSSASVPPMSATTTRTVLPPLEVEVVAGDNHRTLRPGTNSVHVDLQPGSRPQPAADALTVNGAPMTAAGVTTNAAERVQMSADTAEAVTNPVKPGYPMLARQMKVQGSVILQALIGRDGSIQSLHVLSGPAILANAAEEAVRQWRFKPHYVGSEAVETQAKITVNFTISTN
jgi:TonB family protein